jgi:DNA polymerase elongation subunit (family B)
MDSITFQALDWSTSRDEEHNKALVIDIFGMTLDNKHIHVSVKGYRPYFFVLVESHWTKHEALRLLEDVKYVIGNSNYPYVAKKEVDVVIVKRHKFWGFTNDKLFTFVKFKFVDCYTFRTYQNCFESAINGRIYELYESNIEPQLRFMHARNLKACGWISLTKYQVDALDQFSVNWQDVHPVADLENEVRPFTIAAIDIECISQDHKFPMASRRDDKIIMIATSFSRYGEDTCYARNVIVLGTCHNIPGVEVIQCATESGVLQAWSQMIQRTNPDFITGWNIFGFDEEYMYQRCLGLQIWNNEFRRLSRTNDLTEYKTRKLASSALGDNIMNYFNTIGRVHFDLMKIVQRDHKLGSYKLDSVAATFFREIITHLDLNDEHTIVTTDSTKGVQIDQFTTIVYSDGINDYEHMYGKKLRIIAITKNTLTLDGIVDIQPLLDIIRIGKYKVYWCQVKDDIKPQEISAKFKGSIDDRTELAKYNVQDCELCNKLVDKLQIITSNMSMANVCHVPLSYIFMRGQGIKIFSLVSKKCREKKYLIPVIKKSEETTEYEGAIVFEPTPGLYLSPIFVLDFASLYPNSMRLQNLSHECLLLDQKYANLPGYTYNTIRYSEKDTCVFVKNNNGTCGILPEILSDLLVSRAQTNDRLKKEKDAFKAKVLNQLQLAYKITANSLYGQTGASTSPICMKEIAACTTATGRDMLKYSRHFVQDIFKNIINYALDSDDAYYAFMLRIYHYIDDSKFQKLFDECTPDTPNKHNPRSVCLLHADQPIVSWKDAFIDALKEKIRIIMKGHHVNPIVIYGDTDSVFVNPVITDDATQTVQTDKNSLDISIKLGMLASMTIGTLLPDPMKQEYEKCLWPFIQISKKRYVGNMYVNDTEKYSQKSMGIVMKRRDYALITKIVCGGVIDQLLNEKSPRGARAFIKQALDDILSGNYGIDKFVITKTLKEEYKQRKSIAHAVLADRMAARDPGNKPMPNDRIPYVFIQTDEPVKLQGDHIETLEYASQHKLQLDYMYYITNQIQKPIMQFLALVDKHPEKIFARVRMIEENRQHGIVPINCFFKFN